MKKVSYKQLPKVWELISKALLNCDDTTQEILDNLKKSVSLEYLELWLDLENEVVAITEIEDVSPSGFSEAYEKTLILHYLTKLNNKPLGEKYLLSLKKQLETKALQEGCAMIRFSGSHRWAKLFPEYKENVTYSKRVVSDG